MQTGDVLKPRKETTVALRYLIAVLVMAIIALFAGAVVYYQGGAPAAQPITPPAEQPAAPPAAPPVVTPPVAPSAPNATPNASQPPVAPPAAPQNETALPPTSNETAAPTAPAPPVATTPTESPFVPPAGGPAAPPAGNATNATVQEFSINATNFMFTPNNITASTGYAVRLTVTSQSGTHNINIGAPYNVFRDLPAFQPVVIEFTASQSGTFEFWSSVGSDQYLGMNGTLNVVG